MPVAFQRSSTLACGLTASGQSDVITLPPHATSVRVVSTMLGIDPDTTFSVALAVRIGPQWVQVVETAEQTAAGTEVTVAQIYDLDCGDSPQARLEWTVSGGTVSSAVITIVG